MNKQGKQLRSQLYFYCFNIGLNQSKSDFDQAPIRLRRTQVSQDASGQYARLSGTGRRTTTI